VAWEGESTYGALINVGVRPTFGQGALSVEVHVLDFSGDLYGKTLEITVVEKLREEQRFERVDALVDQIEEDIEQARTVLGNRVDLNTKYGGKKVSITAEKKKELVTQYGKDESDSGSAAVQIAILTERINNLTDHLRTQSKDFASRRGLLKLIGQRRRLQNYYQHKEPQAYAELIRKLGLRR